MKKTKIFTLLGLVIVAGYLSFAAWSDRSDMLINDTSLAAGDTIWSGWYEIGGKENVGAAFIASDSVNARLEYFYKFGPNGNRIQCTLVDTLNITNAASDTTNTKYIVLRGYDQDNYIAGTGYQDSSKIGMANYVGFRVRVNSAVQTGTGVTERVQVGIITAE
jgi:hypothetical protein